MTSAGGVSAARPAIQRARGGATPTPALQITPKAIIIRPVSHRVARALVERNHYLHSMPGGTKMAFGILVQERLLGVLTLGCGPSQAFRLVRDATPDDCLVLTRLWLSDTLPRNSESRVIGQAIRALRQNTSVRFLVSYADPAAGHVGGIYQATNWLYTGTSEAMPLYDIGDGVARHSRSLSHAFGTHSLKHFEANGIEVKKVAQSAKLRYVYFVDSSWRDRLAMPVLPYPKKEDSC